jgi:hypothetical protein
MLHITHGSRMTHNSPFDIHQKTQLIELIRHRRVIWDHSMYSSATGIKNTSSALRQQCFSEIAHLMSAGQPGQYSRELLLNLFQL